MKNRQLTNERYKGRPSRPWYRCLPRMASLQGLQLRLTMVSLQKSIDWQCLADAEAIAVCATDIILQAAHDAIASRGLFRLVLAGGRTPQQVYQRLAVSPIDGSQWHIYFGDERCLPVDHAERNSQMATHAWLGQGVIPKENVYVIPAELGASIAAKQYATIIKDAMPFDLVLLGMGEDGHTASLFPGDTLPANETVHAVHAAPKPPPERVSLSRASLSNSRQVLVLVSGAAKRTALQNWRKGQHLPTADITALQHMYVLYDEAAAGHV